MSLTPQERQELDDLKRIVYSLIDPARTLITPSKPIYLKDSLNLELGTTTGTKIGTSATQKLALYGATPIVQPADIGAPSFGTVGDAQTWAGNLRTNIIRALGLSA